MKDQLQARSNGEHRNRHTVFVVVIGSGRSAISGAAWYIYSKCQSQIRDHTTN